MAGSVLIVVDEGVHSHWIEIGDGTQGFSVTILLIDQVSLTRMEGCLSLVARMGGRLGQKTGCDIAVGSR